MTPCPSAPPEGRGNFLKVRIGPRKKYVGSMDRQEFMIAKVAVAHPESKGTPTFSDFPLLWGHWPLTFLAACDTSCKKYSTDLAKILQAGTLDGLLPKISFWENFIFESLRN